MSDVAAPNAVIACHDLIKTYGAGDGAVHALRGISLTIERGESVAIIGPSGSGKSTLLQILGCLDLPSSGRYELAGTDVATLDDDALSEFRGRYIGFVFQSFHLLPRLSLAENVAMPLFYRGVEKEERLHQAHEALKLVRLGHRAHHKPHQLSGGEKQRGAIARAIAHSPTLLLADEPTGNLDSAVKGEILDHLSGLNQTTGITLVMVTHDDETAARAQRLVQVRDGNLTLGRGSAPRLVPP